MSVAMLPQTAKTSIDLWFLQRKVAMLSGLDNLWKERLLESMDHDVALSILKNVITTIPFMNLQSALLAAAVETLKTALEEVWTAAAKSPSFLSDQAEIKEMLDRDEQKLRKIAHEVAQVRWSRFIKTSVSLQGDAVSVFLNENLIGDLFDDQYIDKTVPGAYKIDEREVTREFEQTIRFKWMRARHGGHYEFDEVNNSDRMLIWSLFREVVDRTAGSPAHVNRVYMSSHCPGATEQWRFRSDVINFYSSCPSLWNIPQLGYRIAYIQYAEHSREQLVWWRGHSFQFLPVPWKVWKRNELEQWIELMSRPRGDDTLFSNLA